MNIKNDTYRWSTGVRGLNFALTLLLAGTITAQDRPELPSEADYYRITTVPVPEGIHLEGGGVVALPNGKLGVCTRRGEVWIIENPTMEGGRTPRFTRFAEGLHEPLGLAWYRNALYTAQRGELTRLEDTDGDGYADDYRTIYAWPLSAHYHEYSFGPVVTEEGDFFVTTNVAFGEQEWWRGESRVPWRGWTLKISEDGTMEPWATGMRSPAGYGLYEGELFYTDNQGDWKGSGGIWHLPKGAFTGHPAGLRWTGLPGSPLRLTQEEFYARVDKRQEQVDGRYVKPENIQDEENPDFEYELRRDFDDIQPPAVWLPHGILGISNTEILEDRTGGAFGPFQGQLFVGDQGQSKIMRVVLEKVKGVYQGVAFDFRSGFQSGVMRMDFDSQGNLFVGETNRGWGSAGTRNDGLEYVRWTGKMPFEIKTVRSMPDGFELEFTQPIDRESAEYLDSYVAKSYIYKYHPVYGSPQTNIEEIEFKGVRVSADGLSLRLVFDALRPYHIHEVVLQGVRSSQGLPLLHPAFYFTLNRIPTGEKVPVEELVAKKRPKKKVASRATRSKKPVRTTARASVPLTYAEVEPLLSKNTCFACHMTEERVVGPSYRAIAARNYSDERIVELIYSPEPKNWPEFATPMAPMPNVPRAEALKIAAWINSLDDKP